MTLKAPTACCKVDALLWSKEHQYFMCPCGQTKIKDNGQPVGKRQYFNFKHRGRPKKGQERVARVDDFDGDSAIADMDGWD